MNNPMDSEDIVAWMQTRNANPACPNCGEQEWKQGVGYRLNRLPGFRFSTIVDKPSANPAMPRVYFICEKCSHVRVFTDATDSR